MLPDDEFSVGHLETDLVNSGVGRGENRSVLRNEERTDRTFDDFDLPYVTNALHVSEIAGIGFQNPNPPREDDVEVVGVSEDVELGNFSVGGKGIVVRKAVDDDRTQRIVRCRERFVEHEVLSESVDSSVDAEIEDFGDFGSVSFEHSDFGRKSVHARSVAVDLASVRGKDVEVSVKGLDCPSVFPGFLTLDVRV